MVFTLLLLVVIGFFATFIEDGSHREENTDGESEKIQERPKVVEDQQLGKITYEQPSRAGATDEPNGDKGFEFEFGQLSAAIAYHKKHDVQDDSCDAEKKNRPPSVPNHHDYYGDI